MNGILRLKSIAGQKGDLKSSGCNLKHDLLLSKAHRALRSAPIATSPSLEPHARLSGTTVNARRVSCALGVSNKSATGPLQPQRERTFT